MFVRILVLRRHVHVPIQYTHIMPATKAAGSTEAFSAYFALSASTPGSALPSIHSRNAPPAVETYVKSSATLASLNAATVSPPPATEVNLPCLVRRATALAIAIVASSKGGVSNAPNGPFQTSVLISARTLS